jgi:exopolysaccharide biosynthesis polyprenyl glycosylphosphotransferase
MRTEIRRRGFVSTAVNSLDEEFQVADQRTFLPRVELGGAKYAPSTDAKRSRARRLLAGWWRVSISFDAVLLVAASLAADLGARSAGVTALPTAWVVAFCASVVLIFALRGFYRPPLRAGALDDLREVVIGIGLASLLVMASRALVVDGGEAFAEVARMFVFAVVYVGAGRLSLSRWQLRVRRDGDGRRPTLVLGSGRMATLAAERLSANPDLGLEPVGFVSDGERTGGPLPVLGDVSELELVLHERRIEQLLVTSSEISDDRIVEIADRCEDAGVAIAFIPQLGEKTTDRLTVEHLGGLPVVFLDSRNPRGFSFRLKYALDRVLAALFLCITFPLFAAAAVAVCCSLGRPIFYRQRRVGRDGREFWLLKFRSMTEAAVNDEVVDLGTDGDTAPGGVEGDDRRTRVGAFLRRTSLDELPQLLNVLRGEMSLVGPRPERPDFVAHFQESVRRYDRRLRAKSGITGWAQVNGLRGKTSISDRVEWDNHYIENWSLWLDLKIILSTLPALFTSFKKVE